MAMQTLHATNCSWEHKLSETDAKLDYANMEQKLWTLVLSLVHLKRGFFLGWMEGDGTQEMQGFNSTEMTLSMIHHPPMWASKNSYSSGIPRNPLPLAIGGNMEDTPSITFPPLLPIDTLRRLSSLLSAIFLPAAEWWPQWAWAACCGVQWSVVLGAQQELIFLAFCSPSK